MREMNKRFRTEVEDEDGGEFRLCIKKGATIIDLFDIAEALQRVVDEVERGKKSGAVVDSTGAKVGEFLSL